jgi:hypothetical protein
MAIRVTRRTFYRHRTTGVWVAKAERRSYPTERVVVEAQYDTSSGKIIRATEVLSRKTTLKTAEVDALTGPQPGRVDWALFRTNITTRLKDARRFDITIKGRDSREKTRRFKHTVSVGKGTAPDKAYGYLIWAIIEAMRKRGYRTQYNLETARYRAPGSSKSQSAKLKPLHDVDLIVRVIRR